MGFKNISLGRRAPVAAAAEVAVNAAAPADRSTPAERIADRLARIPFASQQRALTGGVVLSLVALLASVYADNREANNGAAQIEIAGDMLMHSQRLAKAVNALAVDTPQGPVKITISAGIAALGTHPDAALAAADSALYRAKAEGRARLRVAA